MIGRARSISAAPGDVRRGRTGRSNCAAAKRTAKLTAPTVARNEREASACSAKCHRLEYAEAARRRARDEDIAEIVAERAGNERSKSQIAQPQRAADEPERQHVVAGKDEIAAGCDGKR